jgi:hypothetical protein
MHGSSLALLGALLLAAVNTLGDFVWARYVTRHRMAYGLVHGTVLLMALGLYLGVVRRRPLAGALGGAAVGLAAAASYYLLARFIGVTAMVVAWMGLWTSFALLDPVVLRGERLTRSALVRGLLAAVGSGAAFYAISGIWTHHPPGGPNYAYHFLCWTLAFLPGLLALLVRSGRRMWEAYLPRSPRSP